MLADRVDIEEKARRRWFREPLYRGVGYNLDDCQKLTFSVLKAEMEPSLAESEPWRLDPKIETRKLRLSRLGRNEVDIPKGEPLQLTDHSRIGRRSAQATNRLIALRPPGVRNSDGQAEDPVPNLHGPRRPG